MPGSVPAPESSTSGGGTRHPVVEELRRRSVGERTGNKLVIAVAGGGMRGVVTGAMLVGLEQTGLSHQLFDEVIGVPAGAVGSA